jgi:hypothetical protein
LHRPTAGSSACIGVNQSLRTVILVILALLAAASVVYLQHRFDEGDRKSALRIVDEYHAQISHHTIREVLEARHPDASIVFSATTESSCFQHVRVRALVQKADEKGALQSFDYQFLVDINTNHIAPGNDLGLKALEDLDRPPSFSATSSASVSASVSASASAAASATAAASASASN